MNNTVEHNGGALSFQSFNNDITIYKCTFSGNVAAIDGGGEKKIRGAFMPWH